MFTHRISIRDVPADAARELAAAAAVRGPSVQGYFKTRVVVAPALPPDPDTPAATIRTRKAASHKTLDVDGILPYLDADRRPWLRSLPLR